MPPHPSVLDNVVWHSIAGPHRHLGELRGSAGRFDHDVSPFAAVADIGDPAAWQDLAGLVGAGRATVVFAPKVEPPDGWVRDGDIPCLQMVADDVTERAGRTFDDLGPADVPEMLDLIAATQPGPFGKRTIELGRYIGHRVDGRLVAMAGERFRCPGFTEVSAVCTLPDHRGGGLARALVLDAVGAIRARGDEAMLHVATDNTTAIRVYEALGFRVRQETEAVIVRNVGA